MDKIKFGETIELENGKEYVCFGELMDDGVDYVYLVSNKMPIEVIFAKQTMSEDDIKLSIVTDKDEKQKLLDLFKDNMSKKTTRN